MNRKLVFSTGEYYHLFHRGNDRRTLFFNDKDRQRLLALFYLCNNHQVLHLSDLWQKSPGEIFSVPRGDLLVNIGVYCLMPNHFHLLVRARDEHGVSRFMQKLSTSYSMYFNKKYQRTGGVFERPFKAVHVTDDRHLQYLFAYIHLNPVRTSDPSGWAGKRVENLAVAEKFLRGYRFSSLPWYLGKRQHEDPILSPEIFPEYFANREEFFSFLWQRIQDENHVKVSP